MVRGQIAVGVLSVFIILMIVVLVFRDYGTYQREGARCEMQHGTYVLLDHTRICVGNIRVIDVQDK